MVTVNIINEQSALEVDEARLRTAVRAVLDRAAVDEASISLAIVEDHTIRELNRRYLNHDETTDVLSFNLNREGEGLEGELILSGETATRQAHDFGWSPHEELLLYAIHGTLHLVGYEDSTPHDITIMRAQETEVLAQFGLRPCYEPLRPEKITDADASVVDR